MTCKTVARRLNSPELRHIRRTIEVEMIAAAKAGVTMTQAHVGQLEMLEAVGSELYRRGDLIEPPPYTEVDRETVLGDPSSLIRSQRSFRVF